MAGGIPGFLYRPLNFMVNPLKDHRLNLFQETIA